MKLYLIFFITSMTIIFGCQNPETKASKNNSVKTFDFSYSACIKNCEKIAKIKEQVLRNDSLLLKLGANLNCAGPLVSDYKIKFDTLFLDINTGPDSTGEVYATMCNCYYNLEYKIPHIKKIPKSILINNQDLNANTRDSI